MLMSKKTAIQETDHTAGSSYKGNTWTNIAQKEVKCSTVTVHSHWQDDHCRQSCKLVPTVAAADTTSRTVTTRAVNHNADGLFVIGLCASCSAVLFSLISFCRSSVQPSSLQSSFVPSSQLPKYSTSLWLPSPKLKPCSTPRRFNSGSASPTLSLLISTRGTSDLTLSATHQQMLSFMYAHWFLPLRPLSKRVRHHAWLSLQGSA